ncbi:MAG: radical SAM protein [Bacteroidales bacterium]|nr:radical SAM protein [Bacteroidales bacterium]
MPTILFPSPIFGPVSSRRLGVSLGVNLLPEDGKLCTFDCIYCECGYNDERKPSSKIPTRAAVAEELECTLQQMQQEGRGPDVITFAGNGEPTMHPDFPGIIDDTLALRDHYFPAAKVSVLSNATYAHRPAIRQALLRVDNNILKLDTVDPSFIDIVDRPVLRYDVEKMIERFAAFEGKVQIQTMFLTGEYGGNLLDNTTEAHLKPWLDALVRIAPEQVYIYTIDRDTPAKGLQKARPEVLDAIGARVEALGFPCNVSY